jgi:hypothetical protein
VSGSYDGEVCFISCLDFGIIVGRYVK